MYIFFGEYISMYDVLDCVIIILDFGIRIMINDATASVGIINILVIVCWLGVIATKYANITNIPAT